ncbi:DUF4865 family protein [Falsibacillus albus]|uniref:DUF4865 family protein n=1 Tax=Falsibacillus albus TaxID=2478915 RepID=A0A3L7JUY0_9BACI|nr:DUF4865 family protein [Falsibacillus albus]RLQ94546.1 DUF4865 family protein [Falsibacillus albus]
MIAMQYKVKLPKDYDMEIIKKRVQDNSHKTDGFPGLNFKLYLITETNQNENLYNCYAPLYLWNNHEGMNQFIFEGYFDNILQSFGWQQIQIGVPLTINLDENINQMKYVVELSGNISERGSLGNTPFPSATEYVKNEPIGDLLVYNPDKWGFSHFGFYQEQPQIEVSKHLTVYEVLHVSR